MRRVEQIEEQVARLTPDELSRFRSWFERYTADRWDEQIEADLQHGRLDEQAGRARRQQAEGQCDEL